MQGSARHRTISGQKLVLLSLECEHESARRRGDGDFSDGRRATVSLWANQDDAVLFCKRMVVQAMQPRTPQSAVIDMGNGNVTCTRQWEQYGGNPGEGEMDGYHREQTLPAANLHNRAHQVVNAMEVHAYTHSYKRTCTSAHLFKPRK